MTNIKIFPVYHKNTIVFKNGIVLPVFVGKNEPLNEEMLPDNIDDNISDKRDHYAELTVHYWVWKNIVSKNKEISIGFCHYRRFLAFDQVKNQKEQIDISCADFTEYFNQNYTEDKISKVLNNCDIVLPNKENLEEQTIYQQYLFNHPKEDIEECIQIIHEKYSEYEPYIQKIWKEQNSGYFRLTFLMKNNLFSEWCQFCFDILFELEKRRDWSNYTSPNNQRIAGFIAERLFNLWINYQIDHRGIKIKEVPIYFLVDAMTEQEKNEIYQQRLKDLSKCVLCPTLFQYLIASVKYFFNFGRKKQFYKDKKNQIKTKRKEARKIRKRLMKNSML